MRCAIEVKHNVTDALGFVEDTTTVKYVSIQRRMVGEANWQEIKKVNIVTSDDIAFTMLDYTARSYQEYEYRNVITADADYIGPIHKIESKFGGILIGNKNKMYVCLLSPEYTCQREFNTAYVRPYNSQFPHVIHNGTANFSKGTFKGFFNPIGADCTIQMKYGAYADEMADFLSDGTSKLLKTYDGHVWYVQIDTPIKTDNDRVIGLVKAECSWTEIGKVPVDINQMVAG